jgi:hypothetical protein
MDFEKHSKLAGIWGTLVLDGYDTGCKVSAGLDKFFFCWLQLGLGPSTSWLEGWIF